MRLHGVPGGGDWALERMGALFVEGTEHATLADLAFRRVDGNAIMLSRYHRGATVRGCDFKFLGGSAVALWGWTEELSDDRPAGPLVFESMSYRSRGWRPRRSTTCPSWPSWRRLHQKDRDATSLSREKG